MFKRRNLFLLLIFVFVFNVNYVDAATYAAPPDTFTMQYVSNGAFRFSHSTGSIGGGEGYELAKFSKFGGQNNAIYCAEWKSGLSNVTYVYKKYGKKTWDPESKKAIVSGYISYSFNPKNKIDVSLYAKVGITINHFLATNHYLENSRSFPNLLSEYKKVITKAEKYYDDVKKEISKKNLAKPKFNTQNPTLSGSTANGVHTYKSSTITLSNLDLKQYGSNVKYKLSITTNNSNAKVSITGNSNYATSISRDITSSISNETYSMVLYIQGSNIANTVVTVKVDSSNSTNYYTSYLYKNYNTKTKTTQAGKQRLIYPGVINVPRSANSQITVNVPNTDRYNLYINKTDEDGKTISGARFKLKYNNTPINDNDLIDNGHGTFSWTSGDTTTPYDFTKFSLDEVTVPTGYVNIGGALSFSNVSAGQTCLDNNGNEVSDMELCHVENYSYVCIGSDNTVMDPDSNGNCVAPTSDTGGDNTGGETTGGETTGGDSGTGGEGGTTEPTVPEVTYDKKCRKHGTSTNVDNKYCDSAGLYTLFTLNGKTLSITVPNKKNTVTISKRGITGDDEVPGATLKICKLADYKDKGSECTTYKNVDGTDLSWISSNTPQDVTGLEPGSYAIVETIEPDGYIKLNTAVEFSINDKGVVTSSSTAKVTDDSDNSQKDVVVVKNTMNEISISKLDIAKSKELPGATISICRAIKEIEDSDDTTSDSSDVVTYSIEGDSGDGDDSSEEITADENAKEESKYKDKKYSVDKDTGECNPVLLADGTSAKWVSTNEPKTIRGLPAGTYYLVETIAPFGYSTAEDILFRMNSDGTITDKDGRSLKDNKLVMKDAPIKDTKTGILPIIIISGLGLGSIGGIGYAYHKSSVKHLPRRKRKIS